MVRVYLLVLGKMEEHKAVTNVLDNENKLGVEKRHSVAGEKDVINRELEDGF